MDERNIGFEQDFTEESRRKREEFHQIETSAYQEKNSETRGTYEECARNEFLDDELPQKVRWSQAEDDILREFFPTEGKDVVERLCGRTIAACQFRAYKLGIHRQQPHSRGKWLKGEDMLLRRWYPEMGIRVAILLPWRSKPAIHNRANLLGLHRNECLQPPVDPNFYNHYKRKRLLHSQRVEKQRR